MAYVNMTVDGQTKQTSVLTFKDVNNNTKTANLSAVLEASDQQGGGTALETQTITDDSSLGQYGGIEFDVKTSGCYLYSIRPKTKPTSVTRNPFHIAVYIDNDNSYFRAGFIGYTGAGYTPITTTDSTVSGTKCTLTGGSSYWFNKGIEYEVTEIPLGTL